MGLKQYMNKTEFMVVGEAYKEDVDDGKYKLHTMSSFKYLRGF